MGAFSIAFDIVIVGALALPWVLLGFYLFVPVDKNQISNLLAWINKQKQPAIVGVLVFAIAYALGSAVSRVAQDCFDDDDLHISAFGYVFRVGVTESSIRTHVYCSIADLKTNEKATRRSREKAASTDENASNALCVFSGKWIIPRSNEAVSSDLRNELGRITGDSSVTSRWIYQLEEITGGMFLSKEAAVLLKGTDDTERLRQFHDQIIVLRGAAFDALLVFSLCLFCWVSKFRSKTRWVVLLIFLVPGSVACVNHFADHSHSTPLMEFTLIAITAVGAWLLWRFAPSETSPPQEALAHAAIEKIRLPHLILALVVTVFAFLGWWATQILYDQEVIYSYRELNVSSTDASKSSAELTYNSQGAIKSSQQSNSDSEPATPNPK
jgi:hypothetical protein